MSSLENYCRQFGFPNLLTVFLFCLGAYQRQLSPAETTAQIQDLYAT